MPSRPVRADVLTPKSGPKVSGLLVRRDEQGIVFNPYWSPNPEMTWEVIKLPASGVKKVDVEPHPEPEVMRRLQARAAGDVAAAKAVAAYAKEHKLKAHAEMAWALALADKADDAEALTGIGGAARWEAVKHGNVALDPALHEALARYVAEADPKARLALQPGLKAMGFVARSDELERYRRGAASPKGYFEDVPLSLHADKYAAAVYTLFVPDEYEPTRPWPLLIGLHGGGPDGKDGDEVVGSGPSAMNFYRDLASKNGVIVACPTAQTAGWGNKVNEELVKDVIAEVRLLYDVDVDRIHLTGHSMGGYGTWALGPRMADLFATISPMAGNGDGNVQPLVDTKTPIFIYHSADDFIPVAPERAAAKKLRETDLDFVYTELDGQGHGCPESIRAELFAFLLPRRNFDPAYKEVWPRSSFLGKVTPEEKAYLGDPLAALEGKAPGLEDWLAWLRLSGGRARAAATAIGEAKPASAVEGLVRVLKDEKAPAYGRAEAARALGLLGDASSAAALRHAVALEARRDTSVVAVDGRARARRAEGRRGSAGARAGDASVGGVLREQAHGTGDALLGLGAIARHAGGGGRGVGRPRGSRRTGPPRPVGGRQSVRGRTEGRDVGARPPGSVRRALRAGDVGGSGVRGREGAPGAVGCAHGGSRHGREGPGRRRSGEGQVGPPGPRVPDPFWGVGRRRRGTPSGRPVPLSGPSARISLVLHYRLPDSNVDERARAAAEFHDVSTALARFSLRAARAAREVERGHRPRRRPPFEMVCDLGTHTTAFVLAKDGQWQIVPHHDLPDGRRLVPFSPRNNLLTHEVGLLPTGPEELEDRAALVESIPELGPRVPPSRVSRQSEDTRCAIFDALALPTLALLSGPHIR